MLNGSGWALFFEAERVPANQYPGACFADAASWLVDQERYAAFSADGAHHESRYFLTILYLPPPEHEGRTERLLYERTEATAIEVEPHAQLEWFVTETDRAFEMLASILPEAEVLGMPRRSPTCTGSSAPSITPLQCRRSPPISMPSSATRRSWAASSRSSATGICGC